ncbi:MAG TPA: glycosyltransferase, partial [Methylomirabilota bacterium]|nr:glycosyltransferase [Methylomirabilota bacterium]
MLVVGAGASYSTKDVEDGFIDAFRVAGIDVFYYSLEARLGLARRWLQWLWRARGARPEQRPGWPETIYRGSVEALEMALRFEVDWVLAVSGMYFHPDALVLMRRAGLRTAVVFTESPYEDEKQARVAELADMVWTNERTSVEPLRRANRRIRYLRHAYAPARHRAEASADGYDDGAPSHDVVFVGTGFEERCILLEAVDWGGVDLGLYGEWPLLGSRSKLRQFLRGGPVANGTAAALYRRARIGLNLHRSSRTFGRRVEHVQGAESMNPRSYELAACGVFQIADRRAELDETLGAAVPTFESPRELEELVRHYLAQPTQRRR